MKKNLLKKLFIALKLIYISFSVYGQATCSGTMNYSAISSTAPYTRIGDGTSGAIRICLTANSLTGKCTGTNSSIVIYSCNDATCSGTSGILAVWDETTPVGTCLTIYAGSFPCNGYLRVRRFCGGGSASISWTTMNGLTNVCTGTLVTANTNGTDCINATPICTSGTFPGNASGAGYQELGCGSSSLVRGCLLNGENNSAWYTFKALTFGTITFTIQPTTNKDDYDFAVWEGSACPPTTAPIRCSYFLSKGATGLSSSESDVTEGALGPPTCMTCNGFVSELNVIAGETYTVLVNGFATAVDPNYTFSFGGTAQLDCGVLPLSIIDFSIKCNNYNKLLKWTTQNENNIDYFIVEGSLNGKDFEEIKKVYTIGNSNFKIEYEYNDNNEFNYYRIKQVEGHKYSFTETKFIECYNKPLLPIKYYNILGQNVNENTKGLIFVEYEDGAIKKIINQ